MELFPKIVNGFQLFYRVSNTHMIIGKYRDVTKETILDLENPHEKVFIYLASIVKTYNTIEILKLNPGRIQLLAHL